MLTRLGLTRRTPLIFLAADHERRAPWADGGLGQRSAPSDVPAFTVFSNQVAVTLENARLYNHIERLATTDELTQLYNRRGFFLLGEQQMRMARRTASHLLLIFIDVDQLKYINDHYGHKEGDRALIETAEALRATFRSADIVARISGDEFAVLAAPTAGMGAGRLLERLQHEIDHDQCPAGVSLHPFGQRRFRGLDHGPIGSLDELLARADAQMYQEKRRKPGHWC